MSSKSETIKAQVKLGLERMAVRQCVERLLGLERVDELAVDAPKIDGYITPEDLDRAGRTALDFRFVVLCVVCRVAPEFLVSPQQMASFKSERDVAAAQIARRDQPATIDDVKRSMVSFWRAQVPTEVKVAPLTEGVFSKAVADEMERLAKEAITENLERAYGRAKQRINRILESGPVWTLPKDYTVEPVKPCEPALPTKGRAYFDE